jgi:hypothetical protein
MADDKVTILIDVDAKDAQAAIELFGKESAKVLQKTEKQNDSLFKSFKQSGKGVKDFFGDIQSVFLPITAAVAGVVTTFQGLSLAIEQAAADAKLTRQIEASLRATDEASQEAVTSVLEFADAIKETTGLSDDLAKETYITAKSFGVTSEEAKKLTKAAIDLAAATGVDVETAVRQLGGTLDGSIGKVGNLGAEFRNLTEAQLKSGAAVDLVAQKFGGSAAKELDTFSGASNQLTNAWEDLLKAIGKLVTESTVIISSIKGIAGAIKFLGDSVLSNPISKINDDIKTEKIKQMISVMEDAGKQSKETSVNFASIVAETNKINQSTTKITNFADRIELMGKAADTSGKLTGKALEEATKKARDLADEGKKFKEGIFSGFGDAAETEAAKAQQALLKSFELEKKGALSSKEAYNIRLRIATDFNAKRVADAEKSAKEEADKIEKTAVEAKAEIEKIAASPVTFFLETNAGDFKGAGVALASAFDKALSGRQGATQLFSSTIGTIAEKSLGSILPGIGGLVGSIIGKLAAGPEQAKAFVKEFIDAIPDIIVAIVDALPEALSAIVEKVFSPEFLQRLGLAIGRSMLFVFTAGLSRFAEEWGRKIGEYMLTPFREWLEPLFTRLAAVFEPFNNAINRLSEIFKPATDAMNRLAKAIEGWNPTNPGGGGGVGGGLGGLFERAGKALGFAEGGIVPMYAADGAMVPRGTDTVPAMLTPGEMVIPRDMVGELGAFLSAQNNTGGDGQAAMLAAILSAVQAPIVVKTEAKVNQNAFADIILQLNRQNARLAV